MTTREFIHTLVHLLGLLADCGGYLIFGMLSSIYDITAVDYRWVALALGVSFLSRYTAIASIIDWFFSKRPFIKDRNQSYLLYFICQGTVSLSIIIRSQGELLDTSNSDNMLRTVLFMIFFSVVQIIIIANPLINRKSPNLKQRSSSTYFNNPFIPNEDREDRKDDRDDQEDRNDQDDQEDDQDNQHDQQKYDNKENHKNYNNVVQIHQKIVHTTHTTDRLFPYLVKIDNTKASM